MPIGSSTRRRIAGSAACTSPRSRSGGGTSRRAHLRQKHKVGPPANANSSRMSHDALTVDIKSEHDGAAIVYRLRGSLDFATAPSLRAALIEAANEGKHEIIVDLSQLEFLDSTGL